MSNTTFITVPWELLTKDLQNIPIEIRINLISVINTLRRFDKQLSISEKWINVSITKIDACLDRTWETLNSGYWKDVPIKYRYCYSLCIIIKAILLQHQLYKMNVEIFNDQKKEKNILQTIIKQIDKGILLGAPLPSVPSLLTAIATNLNKNCAGNIIRVNNMNTIIKLSNYQNKDKIKLSLEEFDVINSEEIPIDDNKINDAILPGFSDIIRYKEPSMETFYRDIFMPKYPAVLTDCMTQWKALTLWKKIDYLNSIAGSRTVPIEIGTRYTEEDWTQHLINFSEFLQEYIINENNQIGYLAQHQLFEQIPELKEDFVIPEYCSFSDNQENDIESVDINSWFGPGGTISPLHFDPKNNLLCQVFGYKRVILYHPDETDNLYPYDTKLLNNTAQVDPINPDYNRWPSLGKARGIICYLKPGEILYIPPKWWHHVTAITSSFSVSFWWK